MEMSPEIKALVDRRWPGGDKIVIDGWSENPVTTPEAEVSSETENATCQWEARYRQRRCKRILDGDHHSLCILHNPNDYKDHDLFISTLEKKIEQDEAEAYGGIIDLSGVVFPLDANFRQRVFKKHVSFYEAQFRRMADFGDVQFYEGANFHQAHFGEGASTYYQ